MSIEKEFDFSDENNFKRKIIENNNLKISNTINNLINFENFFQGIVLGTLSVLFFVLIGDCFSAFKKNMLENKEDAKNQYIEVSYKQKFDSMSKDINEILPQLMEYSQQSLLAKYNTIIWINEHIVDNHFVRNINNQNQPVILKQKLNSEQINFVNQIISTKLNNDFLNNETNKQLILKIKTNIFLFNNPKIKKEFQMIENNNDYKSYFFKRYQQNIENIKVFNE